MSDSEPGNELYSLPILKFKEQASAILKAKEEYRGGEGTRELPHSNFLKGAKWSPDGSCLASASDDTRLRIYDLPGDAMEKVSLGGSAQQDRLSAAEDNWMPAIAVREGETIYDYAWFPPMSAADPLSCVVASTCRAHPVHLWDACTGKLRCSYRAYDAVDEVTAATSLAFSADGSRLFGGFNRAIRIWETERPGREYEELITYRKGSDGLPGIVSCMDFNPGRPELFAAGAYSGQAALFDSRTNELLFLLQGQKGGLTQVKFGRDGNFLFTGARADRELWCWDVRYDSGVIYRLERDTATTNQRIAFDIEPCGRHLATGGEDGRVQVFDLSVGSLVSRFPAAHDTVNGFSFHPFLPLAATASGQRRYLASDSDSDADEDARSRKAKPALEAGIQNTLLAWRFEHDWMTIPVENLSEGLAEGAELDDSLEPRNQHANISSQQLANDRLAGAQPREAEDAAAEPEEGELVDEDDSYSYPMEILDMDGMPFNANLALERTVKGEKTWHGAHTAMPAG